MLMNILQPRYQDQIGRLQLTDGSMLWNVYVTTGAIEKLSNAAADEASLGQMADTLREIARDKVRTGQTLSDTIWIRSLDIHKAD